MTNQLVLKPGRDASLHRRHPWIFSGGIQSQSKTLQDGDVVDIMSSEKKFLGRGHYSSGSIAAKVLTFDDIPINRAFWERRFDDALNLRKSLRLVESESTTAYRFVHAEGDGVPGLVIDRYGDTLVIEFQTRGMLRAQDEIVDALKSRDLGVSTIFRRPFEIRTKEATEAVEGAYLLGAKKSVHARENGYTFEIDWEQGQKTGFFLDQRESRKLLERYVKGARVLNLFSYTGGFSVYALGGGASHVDSVDSSEPALAMLEKNISLNFKNASHEVHSDDCFDFLHTTKDMFDVIVVDPPAFVKHRGALEGGLKGYTRINQNAMQRLKPGGLLFTFSCSQLVDRETFWKAVSKAALLARREARVVHTLTQAPCHPVNASHPESEYLKGLVLSVL